MDLLNFTPFLAASLCFTIPITDHGFSNSNSQRQPMNSTKPVKAIKTEEVIYTSNHMQCNGFIAYDENQKGKIPVVIIVHEWWGLNDYAKSRAIKIANLGYFAFVADLFGNGKTASNPDEARAYTKPYYSNPENTLQPIEAAIEKAATFPNADITKIAAMGYCFGGFVVVNAEKLGAPLKGVVSFHGRLVGVQPKKDVIKGKILICQGGADEFAPEADQMAFKKSMDSIGADYTFISYPGAKHAYTNPNSTALGIKFNMPMAYNASADSASWEDMQHFFLVIFK
jgi:dienelactone hydrolase